MEKSSESAFCFVLFAAPFLVGDSDPGPESPISFCEACVAHVPPGANILGATSEISWALAQLVLLDLCFFSISGPGVAVSLL